MKQIPSAQKFKDSLGLSASQTPFPWQEKLLTQLQSGIGNRISLDVPTGLGKTSAMAAWLVAKAGGADVPRRLVYIVDRRAVVDQATREAERLRQWVQNNDDVRTQLGLVDDEELAISTLRGQFADNREWLTSPAAPAIVVGTVDMIGSRLLFEGYGVSRKMRPYHAGFLGSDSLFVLDEAHLVPPFEALLATVVGDQPGLIGHEAEAKVLPRSILLSLSATGRSSDGDVDVLRIGDKDLKHPESGKRLNAVKRLEFVQPTGDDAKLHDRLANEAWQLSKAGSDPTRIIVFCNRRDTAESVGQAVEKLAKDAKVKPALQLFVGARRVRERQEVERWLEQHGFLAGSHVELTVPAFVFSTSAGEVGVDIDADHMCGDVVQFERMAQRCGRVNRRGNGEASIRVLLESEKPNTKEAATLKKALGKSPRERNSGEHAAVRQFDLAPKYRAALQALPRAAGTNGAWNASPNGFRELKLRSNNDEQVATLLREACTPPPLRPELTRPVLDAWSMTSLDQHAGRTDVAPWLRGWVDDEPQTVVVWRTYLPTCSAGCSNKQIEDFFESAPIHLTEKLQTTSKDVSDQLIKRVGQLKKLQENPGKTDRELLERLPDDSSVVAILMTGAGDVVRTLTFADLQFDSSKQQQAAKKEFGWQLRNNILVLDARLGGLQRGLYSPDQKDIRPTLTIDDCEGEEWIETKDDQTNAELVPSFRVCIEKTSDDAIASAVTVDSRHWKECFRLPILKSKQDEPTESLVVWKFRKAATSEASRSTTGPVSLEQHHSDTEEEAVRLATQLNLPGDLKLTLQIAARNHDHGKNTERWQDAFSASDTGRPYAKTDGPFRNGILDGYRHEFGSLPLVAKDPELGSLSKELQDLALHLVAAHHGFARPVIRTNSCDDAPPSALQERAREVALRFERLQQRWGPWGLAWMESLLRAADHRASAATEFNSSEKRSTPKAVEGING